MGYKEILGLIGTLISFYGYFSYIRSVLKKETKPHFFSWVTWGLVTAIAFAAQLNDLAGPGAWITGFTSVSCFTVAILSLKYGEKDITRSDWVCLIIALSAIPLWVFTKDALWSVILVTLIDTVIFIPTFRKSWTKPHEELLLAYLLSSAQFAISLLALDTYIVTTTLYPLMLTISNTIFVVLVVLRRRYLAKKNRS